MAVEAESRDLHPVVLVALAVEQLVIGQRSDPIFFPLQFLKATNDPLALILVVDGIQELEAVHQVTLLLDDALQLRQDLFLTDLKSRSGNYFRFFTEQIKRRLKALFRFRRHSVVDSVRKIQNILSYFELKV